MVEIELTEGSLCAVLSMSGQEETIFTQGTFIGYTYIGKEEGLCIILDKTHEDMVNKTRIIPVNMIISIDLLEHNQASVNKEDIHHYYG